MLAVGVPAYAQEATPAGRESESARSDPEIVVSGVRLRDPEELPVKVKPALAAGNVTRAMSADTVFFARCAGPPRLPLMRRIVDGLPDTVDTQSALHQHIMRNSGCFQDIPALPPYPQSPHFGVCNAWVGGGGIGFCRAILDRGFVFEQALRAYAPDLRLSRSNTFDHATRDRFRAREETRNGARFSATADYFYTAACMVQIRPEYALALLQEAPGSDREGTLRAMMISDGAPCIGGVGIERVSVEGGQFRAFVAEAVYSWAVAVKRTGSLLPPDG